MFVWFKKWFPADLDDERFRAKFESTKPSTANLSRIGDKYVDPAIEEDWRHWVDLQRLDESAW